MLPVGVCYKAFHETHFLSVLSVTIAARFPEHVFVVRSNQKASKSMEEAQKRVVSILLSDVLPVIS